MPLSKELKLIIKFISDTYDIEIINLENQINNILNDKIININKCIANINKDDTIRQCTRSKKCGNFCVTHFKQNENNELKHGIIENNDNDKLIKPKIKQQLSKNYIELEYLTLNNTDYLYNPTKRLVYDFETKKQLGKLDFEFNIIKKILNKNIE
jgi:hypothetical protein